MYKPISIYIFYNCKWQPTAYNWPVQACFAFALTRVMHIELLSMVAGCVNCQGVEQREIAVMCVTGMYVCSIWGRRGRN